MAPFCSAVVTLTCGKYISDVVSVAQLAWSLLTCTIHPVYISTKKNFILFVEAFTAICLLCLCVYIVHYSSVLL
jgi:hypothetical protein